MAGSPLGEVIATDDGGTSRGVETLLGGAIDALPLHASIGNLSHGIETTATVLPPALSPLAASSHDSAVPSHAGSFEAGTLTAALDGSGWLAGLLSGSGEPSDAVEAADSGVKD